MTVAAPIIPEPTEPPKRTVVAGGAISAAIHVLLLLLILLAMLPPAPPGDPIPIDLVLEIPPPPPPPPEAAKPRQAPQIATQAPVDNPPPPAQPAPPAAKPAPAAMPRGTMEPFTVRPTDFQRSGANWLPVYPESARANHLQGQVVITVDIDSEGRPQRVVVARSSGHASLDEAARQAVRFWKFKPPRYNGHPVTATVDIPFDFRL